MKELRNLLVFLVVLAGVASIAQSIAGENYGLKALIVLFVFVVAGVGYFTWRGYKRHRNEYKVVDCR